MSVAATTAVFEHSKATVSDLAVLLALADRSHQDGTGEVSHQYLARRCGLSERRVRRSLARLIELGEIEVSR